MPCSQVGSSRPHPFNRTNWYQQLGLEDVLEACDFQVVPEYHRSELDFLSVEERGCLLTTENEYMSRYPDFVWNHYMGLFLQNDSRTSQLIESFSTQGCYHECKMQYAAYTCGCVPWYYPKYKGLKANDLFIEGNNNIIST